MVRAEDRQRIEDELTRVHDACGLQGEVKWSKVRPFNCERFAAVLDRFFDFVEVGDVKLRYMWIDQHFQNPNALNEYHHEHGYYILYFYFLAYCFGLPWHDQPDTVNVEFFPDRLPDEPEKRKTFESFLLSMHGMQRFKNRSRFRISAVADVESKKHPLLQCADTVIGAVGFRLNNFHKATNKRGRREERTKVKEWLYKRIYTRLAAIDMNDRGTRHFSVGVNTGTGDGYENRWLHKFRQWDFKNPRSLNPDWADPR